MVVSIPQLLSAKRPVLACLTVVMIVLRQSCSFSSPGQPLEGSSGSLNGVAEGGPEMISKGPDEFNLPQWIETAKNRSSISYNPYPNYNGRQWREKWKGTHKPCMGPRGQFVNDNPDDMIAAYPRQKHAPAPLIGSYDETGLDTNVCFERTQRMLPYGFKDPEAKVAPQEQNATEAAEKTDLWTHVRWGELQQECITQNQDRYDDVELTEGKRFRWPVDEDLDRVDEILIRANHEFIQDDTDHDGGGGSGSGDQHAVTINRFNSHTYRDWKAGRATKQGQTMKQSKKKSALVLRTYDGVEWTPAKMQHVRSYIMELNLHAGGEYEVIILSEVKDDSKQILDCEEDYRTALKRAVPPEFRDITLLFNLALIRAWYPLTHKGEPDTQTQEFHMHQPMQLLSLLRPDITHFWQAELDTRYTGHHYSLLESASTWSTATPRRLLWERNKRYYFPTVHGSWNEYNDLIANMTPNGGIWGPVKTRGAAPPVGPTPPFRGPELDVDYEWGVGEDADLLALAPAFEVTDIAANTFMYNEHKFGYPDGSATPAFAVGTVPLMRFSQRLLRAMHHGQMTRGFDMMPEMYPQSTVLHHGLKLVSFPLPMYVDMAVSASELEEEFSANEGATMLNSPYEFRDVWRRMTYWHTMDGLQLDYGYVRQLWDRWTGREFRWEGEEPERLCLPQILMHPIKEG